MRGARPERFASRSSPSSTVGVAMQLTMTLSKNVSEADIAWVVRQGLKHRNVRLIAMQPAFFSGRTNWTPKPRRG